MHKITLYSRAKSGAITQWSCWTEGATIYSESGFEGGSLQVHTKIAEAKNVGRSNETTPEQQATLEAESMVRKKQDKGYVLDKETLGDVKTDTDGFFKPMLAKSDRKKIKYGGYIQPKLDGVRCLAFIRKDGIHLRSRQGKPYEVPQIIQAIENMNLPFGTVLDGEIFTESLTFQQIIRGVKKDGPERERLEYHIYDGVFDQNFDLSFSKRHERVKALPLGHPLVPVRTNLVYSEEELSTWESRFLALGYEGAMFRNADGKYEASYKSSDLIKIKTFVDSEYKIVGGLTGVGKFEKACIFVCETKSGQQFQVVAPGTIPEKEEYYRNLDKCIGKNLTVKYQELTDDGIPRFPVGLAIRDYE